MPFPGPVLSFAGGHSRSCASLTAKEAEMKTPFKAILLPLFIALLVSAAGWTEPARIGTVFSIDGTLWAQRADGEWYHAFLEMPVRDSDRFRLEGNSAASVELSEGTRLGLNSGTRVKLLKGDKPTAVLDSGVLWVRREKSGSGLEIHSLATVLTTSDGPYEMIIEVGPEQETTVIVLEGEVSYLEVQKKSYLLEPLEVAKRAGPGAKVTIAHRETIDSSLASVEQRQREADERHGRFMEDLNRQVLRPVAGYYGGPAAGLAVDVVTDPDRIARKVVTTAAGRLVPFGGRIVGGLFGGGKAKAKKPDFVTGLQPSQSTVSTPQLDFTWKRFKKADSYLILLSRDESMEHLDWRTQTGETSLLYPKTAPPIVAGATYFWRVVPLNADGSIHGKASQTWFAVPQ